MIKCGDNDDTRKGDYSYMYIDIRMEKCDIQAAIDFIEKCRNQWIYIKNVCNIYLDADCHQNVIYTKFRVRNICTKYSAIEIYGEEDEDRLLIDYECIVSTQMTTIRDELLIIVEYANTENYIRIKKYIPLLKHRINEIVQANKNVIVTEGKTDWKHLKSALNWFREQGEYLDFEFEFFEYEEEIRMGADTLLQVCQYNKIFPNSHFKIFIFDADKAEINEMHKGRKFMYHGNNVFSLIIPVPEFRVETPLISIENYYTDDEIRTQDDRGYRLYLNVEFNHDSGKLIADEGIVDLNAGKHRTMGANYIIDNNVFRIEDEKYNSKDEIRKNGKSVALSKNKFAENILYSVEPFNNIKHDNFRLIFDIIMEIKEKYERNPYDVMSQDIKNK